MKEKVLVFGRGWYYENKKRGINAKYQIVGFLDNSVSGKIFDDNGIPIYNPKFVTNMDNNLLIIITSTQYFIDMLQQLMNLKIDEKRVVFAQTMEPFYDDNEKSMFLKGYSYKVHHNSLVIYNQYSSFNINSISEYKITINTIISRDIPAIQYIRQLPIEPTSRQFGMERGTAIDRYYIENFLKANSGEITGYVLEIGDNFYTNKFGNNVLKSMVLHVEGMGKNVIKGNLATGEGINEEMADCLICTQTIQMIYELDSVVKNIYRLLRRGGCGLITMHGIAHLCMSDYKRWGEYWRFTCQSAQKLFENVFENVEVISYGNVKVVTAFLYGLCQEDMTRDELDEYDEQYPLIITVKVRK